MKFSFIIPVYNCKTHLPGCVESIRAVGVEDYEILLIDDGSTDGSGALCDELADQHSEIRVVHQKNAGASAARNRGLREAAGELLLFVDADDSVDADALGKVLEDPRTEKADLTIFGMTFDYYFRGKCYRRDPLFHARDDVMDQHCWGTTFVQLFRDNSLSPIWNKVFQKKIIRDNGLELDTTLFLYEDFEFVLRYMAHCDTIRNVPQAIYHYRQSEDEGNAGRRMKRISSIPEFLTPIETALRNLPETVCEIDKATVLQQLHFILAREKSVVSDIKTIRAVCRDYRTWAENRLLPMEPDSFQTLLLEGKATKLYLRNKKTQLRHWVAVRVKALFKRG